MCNNLLGYLRRLLGRVSGILDAVATNAEHVRVLDVFLSAVYGVLIKYDPSVVDFRHTLFVCIASHQH